MVTINRKQRRKKKKLKIPSNQGGERVQVAFLNGKSYRTTELKAQSRYNRVFPSLISNMDFQFSAIWAAQGSKGNSSIKLKYATFEGCAHPRKKLINIKVRESFLKIGNIPVWNLRSIRHLAP